MKRFQSKRFTVLVDSREQKPLLFPQRLLLHHGPWLGDRHDTVPVTCLITTKKQKLSVGDYTIEGYRSLVGLERKGCIDEVVQNVSSKDKRRFVNAILAFIEEVKHPYLVFDFPLSQMWSGQQGYNTAWALDRIMWLCSQYPQLSVLWGTRQSTKTEVRRRLGATWLRMMLHHVLKAKEN